MIRISRFERKVLLAIAAVAVGSMLAAVALGVSALRDAYTAGVNPGIRAGLEDGVAARRDHLLALRKSVEEATDAIAYHHRLHDALRRGDRVATARYLDKVLLDSPWVSELQLEVDAEPPLVRARPDTGPVDEERAVVESRGLEGLAGDPQLTVTFAISEEPFESYQRAGELAEFYARLDDSSDYVSNVYVWVYLAFIAVLAAISVAVGAVVSRRVTRRIHVLAEATKRVGAGDLDVAVPLRGDDEIRELTEAFNEMVRDLHQSRIRIDYLKRIGAWQEFARRLAHEIKNPLTPIQLAAQELGRAYEGGDPAFRAKLDEAVDMIEEEVATLRRLVGEFSAFARLPTADLEEADLVELLADVERGVPGMLEDLEARGAAPVEVHVLVPTEPLPARIDAMMLRRGVDNLVRNGAQAAAALHPSGGGEVWLDAKRVGRGLEISVRDNGPGVPPDDVERIFDPYYTTKSEGTGLGLPIVKKVVLEHGGTLDYEPREGGGATFRIALPGD